MVGKTGYFLSLLMGSGALQQIQQPCWSSPSSLTAHIELGFPDGGITRNDCPLNIFLSFGENLCPALLSEDSLLARKASALSRRNN